jgi:hypothetical protein
VIGTCADDAGGGGAEPNVRPGDEKCEEDSLPQRLPIVACSRRVTNVRLRFVARRS